MGVAVAGVPGIKVCRYDYSVWVDDGFLYVKAEGREWERATLDTFFLAARRKAQKWLLAEGHDPSWIFGRLMEWDIAKDWATDLPVAVTYKTRVRLTELTDLADAAVA